MNLYVHIPFCRSKCAYCALRSSAIAPDDVPADYGDFIAREFKARTSGFSTFDFTTIYFGGGTPAMLGADGLGRLAGALAAAGAVPARGCEWSMEFNPAPSLFDAALLGRARSIGVNRASIGVQSLDDGVLARAGRIHSAAEAEAAVALAKAAGFASVGIDLIAGLPGDSAAIWRATLDKALALGVQHVSVYALAVEQGTPLATDAAAGHWRPCGDEVLLERLSTAESALTGAGFVRYEISNYALPGHECRHNLACWRGEDYLGLGPGASSRVGLRRRTNAQDWRQWRDAIATGGIPPTESDEALSEADDAEERFVFGLRMAEGVSSAEFAAAHPSAVPLAPRWESALAGLASVGVVEEVSTGRWALTPRGREVADSAIERLMR